MELPVTKPLTIEEYMLLTQREGRHSPQTSVHNGSHATGRSDKANDGSLQRSSSSSPGKMHNKLPIPMNDNNHLQRKKVNSAQPVVTEGVSCAPRLHDMSTNNNANAYNYRSILPAQVLGIAPMYQYSPVMFKIANNSPVPESPKQANDHRGIVQANRPKHISVLQNQTAISGPTCSAETTRVLPQTGALNNELTTESPGFVITSVVGNYSANALDGGHDEAHEDESSPSPSIDPTDRNGTPHNSDNTAAKTSEKEKRDTTIRDSDLKEVDSLMDTINRVAAGEGVLRQRFTPKVKRKTLAPPHKPGVRKMLINDATDATGSETMCATSSNEEVKTFKEIASGELCTNHSLLMTPTHCANDANGSDKRIKVKTDGTTESSELVHSCSALQASAKSKEQSLVGNTHKGHFSKFSYTERDDHITHYLLKTPEKTAAQKTLHSQRYDSASGGRATSGNSSAEKDTQLPKPCMTNTKQQIKCDNKVPTSKNTSSGEEGTPRPATCTNQTEKAPRKEHTPIACNKNIPAAVALVQFKRIGPNQTKQVTGENTIDGQSINQLEVPKQIPCIKKKHILTGNEDGQKTGCPNKVVHELETKPCSKLPSKSLQNVLAHGRPKSSQMPGQNESQANDTKSLFRLTLDKEADVYVVPKFNKPEQTHTPSDTTERVNSDTAQRQPNISNDNDTGLKHSIAEYVISNKGFIATKKVSSTEADAPSPPKLNVPYQKASVSNPHICLNTADNSTETVVFGSQFNPKMTVAQLLRARRLETNTPKEIHVNNPLKLYGKIVNGELTNSASKIVKENKQTECRSKYFGVHVELGDKGRPCKTVTCSEKSSDPESTLHQTTSKGSSSKVGVSSTIDPSHRVSTNQATKQNSSLFTAPGSPASSTKATGSQSSSDYGAVSDNADKVSNSSLSKTFSLKIGNEMYIVKPAKVPMRIESAGKKQSPKVTLPAPKPSSSRKRRLSSEETEHHKILKKKIRRIKKSAIELQGKLAQALDLLPKAKKAKKLRKPLPLANNLSLSLSSYSATINSETANMLSWPSEKNTESNNADSSIDITDTRGPTAPDGKIALTMLISKSLDGEYTYSIQRTKLNFVSKEHSEFHRWFEYSNFPSKLHFDEGKRLAQIDVETIKHGLYVMVHADKSLSELEPHVSATMSATLALYPAHVACIPRGADALVIGKLVNSKSGIEHVELDSGTVDQLENAENLLKLVLGHAMIQDAEVFVDGRYSSVSDNMSPRCHSPMFYTHDMQAYFSAAQSPSDSAVSADVRADKRAASRNNSANSVGPEMSKRGSCVSYSEKAMALKLKQQKLMESCQKLKEANQANK